MRIIDKRQGSDPREVFSNLTENTVRECLLYAAGPGRPRSWWKIGNGLERLSSEDREAIKKLTSEDVASLRVPEWVQLSRDAINYRL